MEANAEKIYNLKYARPGEDWIKTCWRVVSHVAKAEENQDKREKFENELLPLLLNFVFIPGGRILANAGTGIDNLLNCFVLPVEDSRNGIYGTLKNAAEVFAHGGGVGYDFSNVREEGASIESTGGKASGPISFMSLFDQTGEVIQQASRRGAQLGSLKIDHPDIIDFINHKSTVNSRNKRLLEEYKRNLEMGGLDKKGIKYFKILEKTLQDDQLSHFNISVSITDNFMNRLTSGYDFNLISRKDKKIIKTLNPRELLREMSTRIWESGDPGLLFYDRTNEDNMVNYLGDLNTTNPCVTGDTKILTVYNEGVEIKDLVDKDTLIYTWNPLTKLPEVSMIRNVHKTRENVQVIEVEFDSGLKVKCTPDHNFYTFRGNKIQAKDLINGQSIRAFSLSVHRDGHIRAHGWVNGVTKHRYVSRLIWEYFNGKIKKGFILHHKDFNEKNNQLGNFELLTISEHNHVHYNRRKARGFFRRKNHKVVSITYLDKHEDVYNGIVDNTHTYIIADNIPIAGIASGIVSANCGEVPLLPYESCCLGSLNLHAFYDENINGINFEFLEYAVRKAVRFLDNVQTISYIPIDEINEMSKGLRRLGLGVMGWADLLAELELPYDSQDAKNLGNYLSWFISFFGWLESISLAEEKGTFQMYDKDKVNLHLIEKVLGSKYVPHKFDINKIREVGLRNVAITSIAPTGTISIISGVNSGIEPFFALAYKRNITEGVGNTAKDYVIEINPILFRKLKKYGFSEEEIEEIKEQIMITGNLESVGKIPEKIKSCLMTSHQISPQNHIDMQAAWQEFIDNSISKTINVPQEFTEKEIEDLIIYMWNSNLKGGTLYRDKSKLFQILNVGTT